MEINSTALVQICTVIKFVFENKTKHTHNFKIFNLHTLILTCWGLHVFYNRNFGVWKSEAHLFPKLTVGTQQRKTRLGALGTEVYTAEKQSRNLSPASRSWAFFFFFSM